MIQEVLFERGATLVRRLLLGPDEAMPCHRDPFHRVTVILRGESLRIEFRDGSESRRVPVAPGRVDWDEPTERIHRAVNAGSQPYEEITVFFLDRPGATPQPVFTP